MSRFDRRESRQGRKIFCPSQNPCVRFNTCDSNFRFRFASHHSTVLSTTAKIERSPLTGSTHSVLGACAFQQNYLQTPDEAPISGTCLEVPAHLDCAISILVFISQATRGDQHTIPLVRYLSTEWDLGHTMT